MIQRIKKAIGYALLILALLSAVSFLVSYRLNFVRIEAGSGGRSEAVELLLARRDKEALAMFERILAENPQDIEALWGKGEVYRRDYRYKEAQVLFNRILNEDPYHAPSLLSLAYIKYKDDLFRDAIRLVNRALAVKGLDRYNRALGFMMMGTINSRRSQKGWILSKLAYGTQIKGYFLKARNLAPELPEVRLGLGTFYLLAPEVIGGDVDKAIEELSAALKSAPNFATASIRLAQAYQKKGDLKNYEFYMQKARQIDPGTENLEELRLK